MRKLGPLLAVVLLLAVPVPVARSETRVPSGFVKSSCRSQAEGVEFNVMRRSSPAAVTYVGRVAPGSPVRARVVNSKDRIPHHDESLEVPSAQCRRLTCILGVNADFHDSNHEPVGGVVTGGRMLRSPLPTHPQLTVRKDGRLVGGILPWAATIRASDGRVLGLSGINTTRSNVLVLYTRDWGGDTDTSSSAVELVVRSPEPLGAVNRSVSVELVRLTDGDTDIPSDGAVLSGRGSGADALRALWDAANRGRISKRVDVRVESSANPVESVGGSPVLISGGRNVFPPDDGSLTTSRHPRTIVGWNGAGEMFFVVVDGRQRASEGMTFAQAADFMRGLGATEAMNFDGGGGTVFVVDGKVASHPVDDSDLNQERGAPNSWVLTAGLSAGPPLPPGPHSGYWMLSADGTVYRFGDARHHGDATPALGSIDAVDLEPTPSGNGYWVIDSSGRVYGFGDARHRGNVNPASLASGERVTSLSATPSGGGYWAFTSRGRVIVFGDARHFGDTSRLALNGPVLDSVATPSGLGYYMVASDGGVFAFGDAGFHGSMGSARLNAPVQSLVPDPDGVGYWLVASDGGVFSFKAPFRGSTGSIRLNQPMSGMVAFGNGYLMVAEDGGIFNFSDKPFHGSLGSCAAAVPVISVAAVD